MIDKKLITTSIFAAAALLLAASAQYMPAQTSAPKQDKLLNGLKVLMWPDAKASTVYVTLRIHAGSAFDPQGKEGVMRALAANFFPNPSAAEFFAEDLGGSLAIDTTYDYIQINASAKPDSFLTLLDTLSSAVVNTPIDKETTARLRTELAAQAAKKNSGAACVADQAVAARLLGTFPYGRPVYGTAESLARIEFSDLLTAKQKFVAADNATIAISGNFDRSQAMKALRRYFGSWLKSDQKVPWTFRQPEPPPTAVLDLPSPQPGVTEIRYAVRGVSRSGKDLPASLVFAKVIEERLRKLVPAAHVDDLFVRNEPHVLPGVITVGFTGIKDEASHKMNSKDLVSKALAGPVTAAEVQKAKEAVKSLWAGRGTVDLWLDADTFQIAGIDAYTKVPDAVTLADVQAYAERVRQQPMAVVLVNTPSKE